MEKVTCGGCGAEFVPEPLRGGDWCLRCGAAVELPEVDTSDEPEPIAFAVEGPAG